MTKIVKLQVVKPISAPNTVDVVWAKDGHKFREDTQGVFVQPPNSKYEVWVPYSNIACIVREQEKVGTQSRVSESTPKQTKAQS